MVRSLGSQLFVAIWGLALVLIVTAVAASLWLIDAFVHQDIEHTLASSRVGVDTYLSMQRELLAQKAESAAAIPMLKATLEIERLDRATAGEAANMVRQITGASFCALLDAHGSVIASTLRPHAPDPRFDLAQWCVAVDDAPYLIAVAEVTAGDVMLGRLVVGRLFDRDIAAAMRELTGSDVFVSYAGRLLVAEDADGTVPTTEEIHELFRVPTATVATVRVGGISHLATALALPAGTGLVLARSVDGLLALTRRMVWLVAVGGTLGGLFAMAMARLLARRIAKPIADLTAAAANLASGDAEAKVSPGGSVETAALGAAFNDMVARLDAAKRSLVRAERLAAIGQVTVTLNHEINNPLQGLLSTVELALAVHRENPKSPELQEALELIRQGAQNLRDAVRQLTSLTSADTTTYVAGVAMIDLKKPEV